MPDENKEVLQAFFRFVSEHPELFDRVSFTLKPYKLLQDDDKPKDDKDKS